MLWEFSASEAAARLRKGHFSSVELVTDCLSRIKQNDDAVGAWAFLDPDLALQQARTMDDLRRAGAATGTLHGLPVGIKDLYDTADMPTAWGGSRYAGRRPSADAAIAEKLREAGAVILGKTVTTELAFVDSVATRNPHNPAHGSGGSSAGSAAGVAAGHVPLAIGSQTNGSIVRPASYCGIYGFKPTRGLISRRGCLQTSASLDQVGVFGRTLEDVALLADALTGYDRTDPASLIRPKPAMLSGCRADVPVEPIFAMFDLPYRDQLSDATRQGLEEIVDALGERVERLPSPDSFSTVIAAHKTIHFYECLQAMQANPEVQLDDLNPALEPGFEFARTISDDAYHSARDLVTHAEAYFASFFRDYDAIIAPAALGEAPLLGQGTGDPICSTIWTFSGLPCLSLPWLSGETGLPAGIQLIGSAERDDRLLRTAAWLERQLAAEAKAEG